MKIRSALVRPLDPHYPTNLAVLILTPAAGLVLAAVALWQGHAVLGALGAALHGGLTVFTGWALAREIAPDDNPAAFVSLVLALLVSFLVPSASALLALTAMMLARMVTRSVGMPATWLDSAALTLLAGWTVYSTRGAGPALVAVVAFALDAMLRPQLGRQWGFALVCLAGGLAFLFLNDPAAPMGEAGVSFHLPVVTIGLIYALTILLTSQVRSVDDLTGAPLIVDRVRAGMAIAWLMAVQGPLISEAGLAQSSLVWAVLAGLLLTMIVRPTLPTRPNAT